MKFLLGTKKEMTQLFDEQGRVFPATIVSAGPLVVTQIKTPDRDGYSAIQVAYGEQKKERLSKALIGHFKDRGSFRHVREFRSEGVETMPSVGDKIDVTVFAPGDEVKVSGLSKGKGFQGVVKRHGFAGGRRTHGQKHSEREPGAIGGSGGRAGGRVVKGMRMAGRMGGDRVTVRHLKVLKVDEKENLIFISGAIPGRRGTLVEVIAQ